MGYDSVLGTWPACGWGAAILSLLVVTHPVWCVKIDLHQRSAQVGWMLGSLHRDCIIPQQTLPTVMRAESYPESYPCGIWINLWGIGRSRFLTGVWSSQSWLRGTLDWITFIFPVTARALETLLCDACYSWGILLELTQHHSCRGSQTSPAAKPFLYAHY